MTEMAREEVLQILHRYIDEVRIDDCSPDGQPIRLTFEENYVEKTPYSWRVGLRSSREPLTWLCIHDKSADIATHIAFDTGLNIIFSTWDPLPETAEAEMAVVA